jgi:hypothetical protein
MGDEFKIGDKVEIKLNGVIGFVVGIGDFKVSGRQYSVEYALPSYEIKTGWFLPDEIMLAEAPKEEVPA